MKKLKVMSVFGTRPEAVDAGTVKLVGTDYQKIVQETDGDGKTSGRIVMSLL